MAWFKFEAVKWDRSSYSYLSKKREIMDGILWLMTLSDFFIFDNKLGQHTPLFVPTILTILIPRFIGLIVYNMIRRACARPDSEALSLGVKFFFFAIYPYDSYIKVLDRLWISGFCFMANVIKITLLACIIGTFDAIKADYETNPVDGEQWSQMAVVLIYWAFACTALDMLSQAYTFLQYFLSGPLPRTAKEAFDQTASDCSKNLIDLS